jgi:phage terminase small subunit
MKLTAKQEAFAQAFILSGGNASEAYRTAYNAKAMKPETIHRQAHDCLTHPKVATRIAALQQKTEQLAMEKFEISAEERMRMLWRVANDCASVNEEGNGNKKMQNPMAVISAIAELNRMTGHHAPSKMENKMIVVDEIIDLI